MPETQRTESGVVVFPPAAVFRTGGDPLNLAGRRTAMPGGTAEIDLAEIVQLQSAYISELRGKVDAQETATATLALALQVFIHYARLGQLPPRDRAGRCVAPKALIEELRGSTVTVGENADGDMLVGYTERAVNPRWEA